MMFGLPAACLAMLHTARPERRKAVAGMLGSLALTSFLTGVTEPIEFTFMFLAPLLFAIHAVLTGVAMALMNILNVKLGFGFSAGLFDYVLNFSKATHPLLLIPVGLVYGAIYYGVFRFAILRFDLKTPGREVEETLAVETVMTGGGRGADFVAALGGAANLTSVDACTTRLRLIVVDQGAVNAAALKALGARGIVKPSDKALQVVLGPIADGVAGEIRAAMGAPALAKPVAAAKPAPSALPTVEDDHKAEALVAALGGAANLRTVGTCSSRLRLVVADQAGVDEAALKALGARGVIRVGERTVHVVFGPDAERIGEAVRCHLPA
jgi:PTS system N-acetylglucosamine-specific IIC component